MRLKSILSDLYDYSLMLQGHIGQKGPDGSVGKQGDRVSML